MRKAVKTLCLAALVAAFGTTAQAQLRQSVYFGGGLPTGQFASKIDKRLPVPLTAANVGKDAALGITGGYRVSYRFDAGVGEVAPFLGADIFWNPISSHWRDQYDKSRMGKTTYFNIPILVGASYIYDELPWSNIAAFLEFGMGPDILWVTSEGSGDGNNYFAYKKDVTFAWNLGIGAYFGPGHHFSAGLYYYGLGKHNIDYSKSTLEDNAVAAAHDAALRLANQREQRTTGELALRIGFHF